MIINNGIEWEKVETKYGGRARHTKEVWMSKNRDRVHFSLDVTTAAGFKAGDRVDIYRGGSLFKVERSSCGLYTLKKSSSTSNTLMIGSRDVCLTMAAFGKTDVYEAFVNDGCIFFRPKGE